MHQQLRPAHKTRSPTAHGMSRGGLLPFESRRERVCKAPQAGTARVGTWCPGCRRSWPPPSAGPDSKITGYCQPMQRSRDSWPETALFPASPLPRYRPCLPLPFRVCCRHLGLAPSRFVLWVRVAAQDVWLFRRTDGKTAALAPIEPPPRNRAVTVSQNVGLSGWRPPTGWSPAPFGHVGIPQPGTARHAVPIRDQRYGRPEPWATIPASRARDASVDRTRPAWHAIRRYRASTSRFGVGQIEGSNRTPLGLHRVAVKVGAGWPVGTIFIGRRVTGLTWQGQPDAAIAHRILWLEGLEPGLNRGGRVDSFRRTIYIHGVGDETTLGRPASRGCIHLAAGDLMPLFDQLPVGTLVWISAR